MRRVALLWVLVAIAFGQKSDVPYLEFYGPAISNKQVSHLYKGSYPTIRNVDFRNLRPLKKGHYQHDDPYGHETIDLDSIYYLRKSLSLPESSALVLYSWFAVGGSSSQGGSGTVFTLSGGHLQSVQEMSWDTHFQAGQPTYSFDPVTNTLVIRTAHYIPGDAHCCVSAMDVVTLRWDGRRFAQTNIGTELSEYGKEQGKVLPR